ncbi:MAG: hypothetical protein ACR2G3_07415 [Solirubrobacterales bacterium]
MSDAGGTRLDRIARDLASGEVSRRSALKRLAGMGLGLGAAMAPAGVAEAMGGGCPPGRVKCDGRCCPKNARCRNGRCRCKPGFKKCGRKCVNLDTSVKHCGACGTACASGEACIAAVCVTPECTPGQTRPCYSGDPATAGVGPCQAGIQTCQPNSTWGTTCQGEVTPQTEICGNGQDDDCDGTTDNGCCVPDTVQVTCQSQGRTCGSATNNCGQTVDCGSCSPPQTCGGGGVSGMCGCTPSCPPCREFPVANGCGGFCGANCNLICCDDTASCLAVCP